MLVILLSTLCTFAIIWAGLAIGCADRFEFGRRHRAWFTVILLGLSGVVAFLAGYYWLGGFCKSLVLYVLGAISFSIVVAIPYIMEK